MANEPDEAVRVVEEGAAEAGDARQPAPVPPPAEVPADAGASAAPAAAPPPTRGRPSRGATLLANVRWLLGVLLVVFFIRTFIGEATIIPTASMERTILVGDHVFLNKLYYGPQIPFTEWKLPTLRQIQRQEIVAFRYPRDPSVIYVKRVIGVAGDRLEVRSGRTYVNGRFVHEPYVVHTRLGTRENFGPVNVPDQHLFVMGDNRDNSHDSRFWGPVPLDNVVGEPLVVYWSYEASSDDWLSQGARNRARFYATVAMNFFSKTRWSRTGLLF